MNLLTDDPTLGAASGPTDYQALSSGWALGTAAASAWDMGGFSSIMRGSEQYEQRRGQPTRAGTYMFRPGGETPMLEPDAANEKYGMGGQLSWDKPVREGEAKLLNQWRREEIARGDILDRSTPGAVPAVARFLSGMGASVIDPVNIASSFIPVLGEARWAALAGRIGIWPARVARGAAEGLVGSALVEPLTAVQQINQQGQYTAEDAILDIGFGTIGGVGFHALGGAFHDVALRWRGAPMEARAAAFTHSMDALTEGRPVRAAEITEPARVAAFVSSAAAEKPKDLVAFLQSTGGIRDTEGHDLKNVLGQRQNPRTGPLLRESGMSVDDAGEALHEAGYFGDPAVTPRPTEAEVVDLLREASGRKVYSVRDSTAALESQSVDMTHGRDLAGNDLDRTIEEMGVTVSEPERNAAIDMMMSDGIQASDALDHVLERSSIEGGVYAGAAQRLGEIEQRLREAQSRGAPITELAPLMSERAELRADMQVQSIETVRSDATGEGGASDDAVAIESSRRADTAVSEAVSPERMPDTAKTRATEAEQNFTALVKDAESRGEKIDTAEIDAEIEKTGIFQSLKKAAALLSDCMVTHGV